MFSSSGAWRSVAVSIKAENRVNNIRIMSPLTYSAQRGELPIQPSYRCEGYYIILLYDLSEKTSF